MDQAGEIWASFLEHLANEGEEEDALNDLMRLSNTVSRSTPPFTEVLNELEREAESRYQHRVTGQLQQLVKQSIAQIRNGNLSTFESTLSPILRLLRLRMGSDLISKTESAKRTTLECRIPIKSLLLIQVTVTCQRVRDDLRKQLDLISSQNNNNTLSNREELGFVESIEACVNCVLASLSFCFDSQSILKDDDQGDFFNSLQLDLCKACAGQVKQILAWFLDEREIRTRWMKRVKELGGLSLPNSLSSAAGTRQEKEVSTLTEDESAMLDLTLHELSEILSLTFELKQHSSNTELQDMEVDFVSYMVSMDELWLTHNITKAVSHSESIETDMMSVNSIVEDTFHIANTCFARAVHSHSKFAMEATSNHVSGFIADGFFEILKQLVYKDSPLRSTQHQQNSKAALAAQSVSQQHGGDTGGVNLGFAEAINTLASCILFSQELERDMQGMVMACELLHEAVQRMNALLEESIQALCTEVLLSNEAMYLLDEVLQASPYERTPGRYYPESTWVQSFVKVQFTNNLAIRACFERLSPAVLKQTVEYLLMVLCNQVIERRLHKYTRFNALGALQFDKDVRALCDLIISDCQNRARDDVDIEVRKPFSRLRHWAHLVNLDRASDELEVPFPIDALTHDEIKYVLTKRVEPDFFQ